MKLTPFNSLPPKEDHLEKVITALTESDALNRQELVSATKLTRTQALCAVEALIAKGVVLEDKTTKKFQLKSKPKQTS